MRICIREGRQKYICHLYLRPYILCQYLFSLSYLFSYDVTQRPGATFSAGPPAHRERQHAAG